MAKLTAFLLILTSIMAFANTPRQDAEALIAEHDNNMRIWEAKLKLCRSALERRAHFQKRPDSKVYGDLVLKKIDQFLERDWTVPCMAWLIRNHPNLNEQVNLGDSKPFDREKLYMDFVNKFHINSSHSGVFVASMIFSKNTNPQVKAMQLELSEKVYDAHAKETSQNVEVMGTAALACGHFTPQVEGNIQTEQKISNYFKSAAGHAIRVKIGNTTVGEIIAEKAYVRRKLFPGKPVPVIEGSDGLGRKHSLKECLGNTTVLVFWSRNMNEFSLFKDQVNVMNLRAKQPEVKLKVIGVTLDDVQEVRTLIRNGEIQWRNFIDVTGNISKNFRIDQVPFSYIISSEGKILYRGPYGGLLFDAELSGDLEK